MVSPIKLLECEAYLMSGWITRVLDELGCP